MAAAVIGCLITMTVQTSCTRENIEEPEIVDDPEKVDDPETPDITAPEQKEPAEYTILYYGHGASNREYYYLSKIGDFFNAGNDAFKQVNVVVQYKFSTAENLKKQFIFDENTCETFGSKTMRWAVDTTRTFQELAYAQSSFYGEDNADYTCPDSLTSFINWAAKAYPAKNYMLIVHDHGGGYRPDSELPETTSATTRGILADDGHDYKQFTAKSLARALRQAEVRIETLFMDACMMNNLEYQFELQDLCSYIIAPTYSKPSADGAYRELPKLLAQPSIGIEQALDSYCKACVESWDIAFQIDETTPAYTDMTVTRTANIAHLGEVLREFTDRLCDTYINGTEEQRQAIDYCTASAIKVQMNNPYYDAVKYVKALINALPDVYGEIFYNRMKEAFNNCIVGQYFSRYLTVHNYMVDYSVLLGASGAYSYTVWKTNNQTGIPETPYYEVIYAENGEYQYFVLYPTEDPQYYRRVLYGEPGFWDSTWADTYEQLNFDRAVGWSRWLRLNSQWPNLFCPSGLYFELPMPEEEITPESN